jgi:signal transduction histidine kinase
MLLLSTAFAVVLVTSFAVMMLALDAEDESDRAVVRSEQAIAAGRALETSIVNMENGLRGYIATGRRDNLRTFGGARRGYPTQLAALQRIVSEEQRPVVSDIAGQIEDYVTLWALPLIALTDDRLEAARSQMRNTTGRERIDGLRRSFGSLFARERAVAKERQSTADDRSAVAFVLGFGGIALVLGLVVAVMLHLRRTVVRPVGELAEATQRVAAGDLTTRVPAHGFDEVGTLARGFNAMTESLERQTAELERSNRDLQDFAAVASHDLQGPLVTITRLADLLADRLGGESKEAELARHISTSADRLHHLVRDLLAYSKVGQGTIEHEPVDLDDVLRQALDNLAGPIEDAGAKVVIQPLPTVEGDERRLCQVMQNLVSNAVKFSNGESPTVRIEGQMLDRRVRVSIMDNGIGFDPDQASRIFRPFHRLHGVDKFEGSGIGLAIVERIVVQHGGRIWAESRKGEGATFNVELPLASTTMKS